MLDYVQVDCCCLLGWRMCVLRQRLAWCKANQETLLVCLHHAALTPLGKQQQLTWREASVVASGASCFSPPPKCRGKYVLTRTVWSHAFQALPLPASSHLGCCQLLPREFHWGTGAKSQSRTSFLSPFMISHFWHPLLSKPGISTPTTSAL